MEKTIRVSPAPGVFPIGAHAGVTPWRYQKELTDMRAYLIGHAARNVRCALNLRAELERMGAGEIV